MKNRIFLFIFLFILTGLFALSYSQYAALKYDLHHPDPKRRIKAAKKIGELRLREAVPDLIEASSDKNELVRKAVLESLIKIGDERAFDTYVKMVNDPSPEIRLRAIDGIVRSYVVDESGFIAGTKKVLKFLNPFDDDYDPLIVPPYVKVRKDALLTIAGRLQDNDLKVRKAAITSLGILRGDYVIDKMIENFDWEKNSNLKIKYMQSFYKIGDKKVCPYLVRYIKFENKAIHDEAIMTCGYLKCVVAVDTLLDIYKSGIKERKKLWGVIPISASDDLKFKCYKALSLIGDKRAEDIFLSRLYDRLGKYRETAAEGLARIADPGTLPKLLERRKRAMSRELQLALDFALFKLGKDAYLSDMVSEIGSFRYSDRVYGYILDFTPEEADKLFPFLNILNSVKARKKLLFALAVVGSKKAIPVVKTWINSPDGEVSSAALYAYRCLKFKYGE